MRWIFIWISMGILPWKFPVPVGFHQGDTLRAEIIVKHDKSWWQAGKPSSCELCWTNGQMTWQFHDESITVMNCRWLMIRGYALWLHRLYFGLLLNGANTFLEGVLEHWGHLLHHLHPSNCLWLHMILADIGLGAILGWLYYKVRPPSL